MKFIKYNLVAFIAIACCIGMMVARFFEPMPRDNTELLETIKMQNKIANDSIYCIISSNAHTINQIDYALDTLQIERKKSEALFLYHLTKIKNEIKTVDYSVFTDTALLNRLRPNH